MATIAVNFTFHSGLTRPLFRNVRLSGSWDRTGRYSVQWTEVVMTASKDETGCDAFNATVSFDASQVGTAFQWGVVADIAGAPNTWVVATEVPDENSSQRYRTFTLAPSAMQEDYWFVTGRSLGAQKWLWPKSGSPGLRFAVWAPHASKVEVVFAPFDLSRGSPTGYISDDGAGVDPTAPVIPLTQKGGGIWVSELADAPGLARLSDFLNRLYMYRITNQQGTVTYKADGKELGSVGAGPEP